MPISSQQWRLEVGKFNLRTEKFLGRKSFSKKGALKFLICALSLCSIIWPFVLLIACPMVILISLVYFIIKLAFDDDHIISFISLLFIFSFVFSYIFSYHADPSMSKVSHKNMLKRLNGVLLHYIFFHQVFCVLPHLRMFLLLCGDIESNPGPANSLNLCHWNLNSLPAHDFVKKTHLESLAVAHDLDVICVSETFLDSSFPKNDERLELKGYEILRSDFPGNKKRGGVCVYYKEDLPVEPRYDLADLDQCVVLEIRVKRSKCFVSCMYRSPSDSNDEMNDFCQKFESTCSKIALENPLASFILGDFNAKSAKWWEYGETNACGLLLDDISTTYNYTQLIREPTNFDPTKAPSCIDLIFTTQPNIVMESGVIPSPLSFCHHQLVFGKIKFDYFRPPPYKREVWYFEKARIDLIKRSVQSFDWHKSFTGLEVDQQVDLLTNTLLNIFRNFIPHETITCKDKDPPWMSKEIKSSLRRKNRMYKKYVSRGMTDEDRLNFEEQHSRCETLITENRKRYQDDIVRKLADPLTSPKVYWATLNRFTGRGKIPVIPPLQVNGELVTDFTQKANLFNDFFSKQCSTLDNDSSLPRLSYLTEHRISEVEFSEERILKIIKDLNPNKARGFDEISIKMIQMCGSSVIFSSKTDF